jgi:hypothetical protein
MKEDTLDIITAENFFTQLQCVQASAAAVEVAVPLRGSTSFVTNATRIWNACPTLRVANTLAEAKMAAKSLADSAPI